MLPGSAQNRKLSQKQHYKVRTSSPEIAYTIDKVNRHPRPLKLSEDHHQNNNSTDCSSDSD